MSDRLTDAISPLTNPKIRAAYETYFGQSRQRRRCVDYNNLVEIILQESTQFRKTLKKTPVAAMRGIPFLEWCMLADATNQPNLSGESPTNLLRNHSDESSWRDFLSCASHFLLAVQSTDVKQEKFHFEAGKKALGICSPYRPAHIYRLVCYVFDKTNSGADDWFKVPVDLRDKFKQHLPPLLASVAACQCKEIARTADNFRFLSAIAKDRVGFLRIAGDLSKDEEYKVRTLIHFGPRRYLLSTTRTGLLHRAFAEFGQ
jgi:hypothetical protein